MSCYLCAGAKAVAFKAALALDKLANFLTGGDPGQTVSSRLGRAELAGSRWAAALCRGISWAFREPDHCILAVRPGDNARELVDIDGADGTVAAVLDAFHAVDTMGLPAAQASRLRRAHVRRYLDGLQARAEARQGGVS